MFFIKFVLYLYKWASGKKNLCSTLLSALPEKEDYQLFNRAYPHEPVHGLHLPLIRESPCHSSWLPLYHPWRWPYDLSAWWRLEWRPPGLPEPHQRIDQHRWSASWLAGSHPFLRRSWFLSLGFLVNCFVKSWQILSENFIFISLSNKTIIENTVQNIPKYIQHI